MITKDQLIDIRKRYQEIYPKDTNKGIICPLCGSGTGKHGTGITENPHKPGNLKCWACGFEGDIIDLIQQDKHLSFNEAIQFAAKELNIRIEAQNSPQNNFPFIGNKEYYQNQKTQKNTLYSLENNYLEYFEKCTERLSDRRAVDYLSSRGISIEVAKAYKLGFDPEWRSPKALKDGKNPPATPRLIIPTSKTHYIARDIRQNLTDKEKAYAKMNEGKPSLFNGNFLFETTLEVIFITEGVFDALSIIECGEAAIALNSTSNAERFIGFVERSHSKAAFILCLDNDKAGSNTTQTIENALKRLNISFLTADICLGYKDPNEAFCHQKEAFIKELQHVKLKSFTKPDNVNSYIDLLMHGEIDRFREARNRKTGFENLDEKAGGLYSGLYVIAATSSLGKTTFSHQIADQLAILGNDVLFFSLEQSRLELVSKSIARITAQKNIQTAVTSLSIRRGYLPESVLKAAEEYQQAVSDRLSVIEGNFNCNISFIGDYIRKYISRTGCRPVIFVDYLQILQGRADKRQTSKEMIDNTVTELKRLSREMDLTIFVISSVNRANYLTPIDFESLKESGGIEFTADVIWGLQLQCLNDTLFDNPQTKIKEKRKKIREEKAADPRKIELLCLKNRYGVSSFSCYFDYYPKYDLFLEGHLLEQYAKAPKADRTI